MGVFDVHLPVEKLSEKLEITYKLYYGESNPKKLSTIQKKKIQVNTFDTSKYLQFVFDGNEYSFMDVYFTSFISYVNMQQPKINVPQVSYLLGEQLSQIETIDRYISLKSQRKDASSKLSMFFSRNSGIFDVKSVQEFRKIASNLSPEILLSLQEELYSISSELFPVWCKTSLFEFYANLLNDRKKYCGEVQTKHIPNVDCSKISPSVSIAQSKQLQLYTANCCSSTLLKPLPGSDVHVIVFVHGFLGCSEDFRQFRNQYLHLLINNGMLDHRIIFYFSKANEKRSYLNLPTMGRKLAEEVDDYLRNSRQAVTKLSFYCHSLGGLIARFALRNKRLCPYRQLFHQFVTYATPHCSFNLHEHFLLKPFMKSVNQFTHSKLPKQLRMSDHKNQRETAIYLLASDQTLKHFKKVIFYASPQDKVYDKFMI
ncbi:cytosolic factor, phosphatidylinositol/phosphatidylcholine transfer protein [Boothiomyces macroporosus]|uniref:Cytosolic factor, phosphatidylinositol/phosphatidylcholine transfer protein n=1 Tax=Boothiomyces macroporosus TaxID=261099 RepID=A0AAD5UPZ8_9FUNG|nr:cytosolic factor, phosphatidylinositol/phosphatidylcholine transfer protein [Boothiomyces macroporosus]